MFFQGAPRLLRSHASIVPVRTNGDIRVIVEAYPALMAKRILTGGEKYKLENNNADSTARRKVRQRITRWQNSSRFREEFGFVLKLNRGTTKIMLDNDNGDTLDATLCAAQAAWAWTKRNNNFGIPSHIDPLEGWIADPSLTVK